jgi:hypothetical protein
MFGWLQRRTAGRTRRDQSIEDVRAEKSRVEIDDMKLGVQERKLKIQAIQRVVEGEADPVTALEVVTVATHRGRLSPAVYQRRQREQSPLELMALGMLQKRLEEDPTDALEKILDRRERLEEAADRLSGRSRYDDGESGNTVVDVARALANSPLGEAIGAVLGAGAQQRMAVAASSTAGHAAASPAPTTASQPPQLESLPANSAAPPSAAAGPRPVSFRVGMALRALKAMSPADGARWILGQADQHEQLADLVGPFVAAEPSAVPMILEAFLSEASSSADPSVAEWVPLVQHLRDNLEWTFEAHREMRALTLDGAEDDDDALAAGQ